MTAKTPPRAQVHIRLPRPVLMEVDHVGVDEDLDRARTTSEEWRD